MSRLVKAIAEEHIFDVVFDATVVANVFFIGFEVDYQKQYKSILDVLRHIFLAVYIIELLFRLISEGKQFFYKFRNYFDIVLVILPAVELWGLGRAGFLWRVSAIRAIRLMRFYGYVKSSKRLKELALILDAARMSFKALLWLGLIFALVFLAAGAWARGLLLLGGGVDNLSGFNGRYYFGSTVNSALTMFQLTTFDGWATQIVRPLLVSRSFEGLWFSAYAFVTAYTLISLAVGLVVWATCEEARRNADTVENIAAAQDKEILSLLRKYFEASLLLQDRDYIDLQELRDAWGVPEVLSALEQLGLPFKHPEALFEHVDEHKEGRVSLDILLDRIEALNKSASRFDTCCLTARVGGTATFTTRLVSRVDSVTTQLTDLTCLLQLGMDALAKAAVESEDLSQVPEVHLRKAGLIQHHHASALQKYN